MKRGTVVWVNLSDASPPEMGKVRPGVIISGTLHNEVLSTVIIIPTSTLAPEIAPLRIEIGEFGGKNSYAVIPGIRQVRQTRLLGIIGQISNERLDAIESCLDAFLY